MTTSKEQNWRRFDGGKRFLEISVHGKKRYAIEQQRNYRQMGYHTRVVKTGNHYRVFIRRR